MGNRQASTGGRVSIMLGNCFAAASDCVALAAQVRVADECRQLVYQKAEFWRAEGNGRFIPNHDLPRRGEPDDGDAEGAYARSGVRDGY
jgi:hypothetical protein